MAKTIPVVGQAFLGSDPLVPRVLKVTYGAATAVVDVTATAVSTGTVSTAYDELVNFADSGYIITDMYVAIEEAFTAAVIEIGPDSAAALIDSVGFFPNSVPVATVLGGLWNAKQEDSALAITEGGIGNQWLAATDTIVPGFVIAADCAAASWPVDSDDTIVCVFDSGSCAPSIGKMALYVHYQAL